MTVFGLSVPMSAGYLLTVKLSRLKVSPLPEYIQREFKDYLAGLDVFKS